MLCPELVAEGAGPLASEGAVCACARAPSGRSAAATTAQAIERKERLLACIVDVSVTVTLPQCNDRTVSARRWIFCMNTE